MNKPKVLNRLRNIACVLLIITAFLLTYRIFSVIMGVSGSELLKTAFGYQKEEQLYPGYEEKSWALTAVTPLTCAVRAEKDGMLYGTPDRGNASACFEKISPVLTEALETAKQTKVISEKLWQSALSDTMVCLDFGGQIQMGILAQLLGTKGADTLTDSARYIVLTVYRGKVCLFYRDEHSYLKWMETEADAEYFIALCGEYTPNGYYFAYETEQAKASEMILVSPETIYPEITAVSMLGTTADSEWSRMLSGVLESFGINGYMSRAYRENDGTLVYVDEERTLRVYEDGWISFYDPAVEETALYRQDIVGKTARIAEGARIVTAIEQSFLGDAGLYLLDASYEETTGQYKVRFGAEIDGIPILNGDTAIAELRFRGTYLVAAQVFIGTFRRTGQTLSVLPEVQAIAAADSLKNFGLYYKLSEEKVLLGWYTA